MNRETIQKVIEQAVVVLRNGGVLLYPADTIWGIGCDARNADAVNKVNEIKGRNAAKPLIVLCADIRQLYDVASSVHPRVDTLLHYHERPLTIIFPGAHESYRHLAAKDGTIGVRVVKSGFCHELLTSFGWPMISTSANVTGEAHPSKFGSISSAIMREVDYALPAFTEKDITGTPSVIAKYDENGELEFLR